MRQFYTSVRAKARRHKSCTTWRGLLYPKGRVNMPGIYYSHSWRGLVCWSCEAGAEAERAKREGKEHWSFGGIKHKLIYTNEQGYAGD
jgi:hypothetical protein